MNQDAVSNALAVWQQTIDVQKHFNDLEMKIRNVSISLEVAVVGAVGLAAGGGHWNIAAAILAGGLLAWGAFYAMDRFWYHPLLRGAVKHAEYIEGELRATVVGIGLTTAISNASKLSVPFRKKPLQSSGKMDIFYTFVASILDASLLAVLWVGGWRGLFLALAVSTLLFIGGCILCVQWSRRGADAARRPPTPARGPLDPRA